MNESAYSNEYVNKQDLLDAFEIFTDYDVHESFGEEFCERGFSLPLVRSIIHEVPTVKCENCENHFLMDDKNPPYVICCLLGTNMGLDDFCSRYEKKTEDKEG